MMTMMTMKKVKMVTSLGDSATMEESSCQYPGVANGFYV
jgi:hypothetical protein